MREASDRCPGALRLHEAADGWLARVRLPGGYVTRAQTLALCGIADDLGVGTLELTSRANVQLRGLPRDDARELGVALADRLSEAGLLPSPAHDRVRNIVASPLAGDLRGVVDALDAALLARPELAALPGKFLFGVEGGDGEATALAPDVTLVVTDGRVTAVVAAGLEFAVSSDDAIALAMALAEAFVQTRLGMIPSRDAANVWRLAELPSARSLVRAVAARSGYGPATNVSVPLSHPAHSGPPGDPDAVVVHVPFGELTSAALAGLAERAPSGFLQITPWRAVVLRGVHDRAGLRAWAAAHALDASDDSPWRWVSACSGRPRCASALTDVRADARASVVSSCGTSAAPASASTTGASTTGARRRIATRWSGCERRCGRPSGEVLEIVATSSGYRTELVDA